MGGKKAAGENSKKAAGNARKADAANQKKAAEDQKKAAEEDKQWSKGSKSNAKKDDAEAKKAEAARKKAERDAMLAAEEASQPSKGKGAGAKTAQKKSRGLDLSQLDDDPFSKKSSALNASGIDNALDALSLASKDTSKIEKHPERRFKAAYAAFEAQRMPGIEQEFPGLRRQQRIDICRKEFEKSDDNPFNQVHVAANATKEEIAAVREQERLKTERRLEK
ncbi:Coiled-coil domain-containing protein [Penicillium malachiteum]|uniref:Coiled-coil domain-containing protein n=1 Tax=Penicillium malachiteum TaxID=1324776 RepID=A0AAD6MQZ1_9EURO|nr:Coiled-coil domain-containing protein [Penicillium malachiteum]